MNNIISDAMIVVRLSVSGFGNTRTDRDATATVMREHGADSSAGRYSKHLIDPAALKKLSALAAAIRAEFIAGSLPYTTSGGNGAERGERLIPARSLPAFRNKIRTRITEYMAAADEFCNTVYSAEVSRAAARLGSLYDPDDYPSAAEVRKEFCADMRDYPIPDMSKIPAGSWIGLAADHERRMRDQLLADAAAAESAARAEVFRRLNDQLVKIAAKLREFNPAASGKDRGIFRDSLITNLIDEVSILPDLIPASGDPELAGMLAEVKTKILTSSVDTLREDGKTRETVAAAAENIAAKLKGIF